MYVVEGEENADFLQKSKLAESRRIEDADFSSGSQIVEKLELFEHYDEVRVFQGRMYGRVIVSASDYSEQLRDAFTRASFAAEMAPPLSCEDLSGTGGKRSFYFVLGDTSQEYDSLLHDNAPRIYKEEFIPMAKSFYQTISELHKNNLFLDESKKPLTILRSKDKRYLLKEFPLAVRGFQPELSKSTDKYMLNRDFLRAQKALETIAIKNFLFADPEVQPILGIK